MTVQPYPLRLSERAEAPDGPSSLIGKILRKPGPGGSSRAVTVLGYPDQRVLTGPLSGREVTSIAQRHPAWFGGGEPHLTAGLVDHGAGTPVRTCRTTTIAHVLWCADERTAYVLAGIDPGAGASAPIADRLARHAISPGDTIAIPAGISHAFGPGLLAYHLAVPAERNGPPPVPGHGLQRFEGFNRRTVCAAGAGFALERWKVTQPMPVDLAGSRWLLLTNLVEPVALAWRGGELIGRAESRLVPAGIESFTLVPDGIAYVLCAYVPDLPRDVVAPLRMAGYRDDEIATVVDIG